MYVFVKIKKMSAIEEFENIYNKNFNFDYGQRKI